MTSTLFLRRILGLDAASCATMGLAMSIGSVALASLFGLPESLLLYAGLMLLPLAVFIGALAMRASPAPLLVWLVIVGNIGWTFESFVTIAQVAGITPLGTAFVAVQALAVLLLALLEYAGLQRARRSAAA